MRGRKRITPLETLQRAEARCARAFHWIRDGSPKQEIAHRTTRWVYGKDPTQQFVFTSEDEFWWDLPKARRKEMEEQGWWEMMPVFSDGLSGENCIWNSLRRSKTAGQIRRVCKQSKYLNSWFYDVGTTLREHAEEIAEALNNSECPQSLRQSTKKEKFLLYLARITAGIQLGYKSSTALRTLRANAHHQWCSCSRCQSTRQDLERQLLTRVEKAEEKEIQRLGWTLPPRATLPIPGKKTYVLGVTMKRPRRNF